MEIMPASHDDPPVDVTMKFMEEMTAMRLSTTSNLA
jgi:hypothetical protein